MSTLHYCGNGVSVTEQVVLYQQTRDNSDYLPIQFYYDQYKDWWFKQVEEYIDRITFNSEFDLKLYWAVNEFKPDKANELAVKNKWNKLGNFNRWFYKVLCNWRSNIRTSSSRHKKRPPVQCPCCGRYVSKITEEHLQHFKSLNELPLAFEYDDCIYQTTTAPAAQVWSWGTYSKEKLDLINEKSGKVYAKDRKKVAWPWKIEGQPVTICPLTKVMVPKITEKHLHSLPSKYSRYSVPLTWQDFIQQHPMVLIQAEIYSLDYDQADDDLYLKDTIAREYDYGEMDLAMVFNDAVTAKYEHVFTTIDHFVSDNVDRRILKLTAIGYRMDDIAETLAIQKNDLKKRLAAIRQINGLESALEAV
jgi:hypothetical protein